jgi:diguanylate cyclase
MNMHRSFDGAITAQASGHPFTPGATAGETARTMQGHLLFDEIGTFLFSNGLDMTALNLMCAHDYLSHANQKLVLAIEEALATRTALTNDWVEHFYADSPATERRAARIASTTEQVEVVLGQCLELVERSRGSAHAYGDALQAEADQLTGPDALPAVERLIGLTRAMMAQTRDIQEELRQRSIETTQLRSVLQSAQREAQVDHLTGLPNRRAFDARLRQAAETSAATERPAAIALCDIDHFKAVNDAHGHDTGDRVLTLVASSLQKAAADQFYVARYGGEEFALIFEDHTVAAAAVIVEELRRTLGARRLINQETHKPIGHITFSAGIAPLEPMEGGNASLKRADTALYVAKQSGRNRVLKAEPDGEVRSAA